MPTGRTFRKALAHLTAPQPPRRSAARLRSQADRLIGRSGFTLLELMIVITIIMILLAMGAGRYERSVIRSREAALKQDLFVMRQSIDQYTLDKQQAPSSLEDLVSAEYLRGVPTDPVTNKKDWRLDFEDVLLSPEQTSTGITNVHSASEQVSPFDGTSYSSW